MPVERLGMRSCRAFRRRPLAGDDQALHLVGALADAGERRVAIEPLDVVFLGIAVGAMDAHRFGAVLQRRLGGEVLGHAGLHVAAVAAVEGLRGVERQQPGGAGARRHLADLERDRLVLDDRLAEGLAQLGVVGREPAARPRRCRRRAPRR